MRNGPILRCTTRSLAPAGTATAVSAKTRAHPARFNGTPPGPCPTKRRSVKTVRVKSPPWQTADDARRRELQEVRAAPPPRAGRPGRYAGRRVHPTREGAARTPAELRMLRRPPGAGPAPAALLGDRLEELRALTEGSNARGGQIGAGAVRTLRAVRPRPRRGTAP